GLAPLMTGWWYATPLRRLTFLGVGASDYHDLLARPGREDAVASAFHDWLRRHGGWQIADLPQLREMGLLRPRPPRPELGLTWRDAPQEACPFLPLPDTWDALLQTFGKKTRSNLGYYDRALRKVFAVEVGPVTDAGALDDEMTRLFELHQRRWNQRWLPGVFGGRRVQRFHREAARALLERGNLRLFTLKLDGETQAALYCFAFGDRLCYYQGGFEPTLAKWSLGTVLTAHAMQSAIAEHRAVFDFLRGDEPYKAKWTAQAQVNARRLLTRPRTPFGPLARAAQRAEYAVERRVKAWMRRQKN
ncbi:MAG: GNAT family N-acetyltransferase, partial [Armatimonadetes bacterium]|nr:GNAT family N-acetyltransferase [Armatimonadota bacterium]